MPRINTHDTAYPFSMIMKLTSLTVSDVTCTTKDCLYIDDEFKV